MRRALTDNGYAYAKVKSDAAVDIVTHNVDIVMTVTPGPKCVFGEVRIEGVLSAEFVKAGKCRVFREWWHSAESPG